jgi:hypothetical protein
VPKPFKGKIDLDIRASTPDWDAFLPDKAPEGAPNVLVVLYDDTPKFEFAGGRIVKVVFDVGKDAYVDVERHIEAAIARD